MTHLFEYRRRTTPTNLRLLSAGLLLNLFGSAAVQAAWVIDGGLRLDTAYDDNVTLSSDDKDDSIVTKAHSQAELRRHTERSKTSAIVGIDYLNYGDAHANGKDLNDKDIEYIDIDTRLDGERSTWGLRGTLRRDVTLATVGFIRDPIGGAPIDDPGSTDEGSVAEQVRRYQTRANPYWDYHVSERTTLQLGYNYQRLNYEQGEDSGLEDSTSNGANLGLSRSLTERDSARIGVGVNRFVPDQSSDADSLQVTVGWERRFSAGSALTFDVGVSYRDQDGEQDSYLVYRLRGDRNTEVGNLFLEAERRLLPNGFGDLAQTDRAIFGLRNKLSETLTLSVTSDAYRTSSTGGNGRDFVSVGPQFAWSFTREVSLGATYRYRWVDREDETGNGASGNVVGIFISYQPQREL